MRPFKPGIFPPIFDDKFFDSVADAPGNVRCVTPTLVNQASLYADRLEWLSGEGSHLLTTAELASVV